MADIKKLVIEVKGEEITIEYDQAREIYEVLKDIFYVRPHYVPLPYEIQRTPWMPNTPWYTVDGTINIGASTGGYMEFNATKSPYLELDHGGVLSVEPGCTLTIAGTDE